MANIIIIENDNRIAQEMVSFVKELDPDHQVRVFDSSSAFEKRYLASQDDKGLAAHPLLLTTPSSFIAWYLEQEYTLVAPFNEPEVRIILNKANLTVTSGPKDEDEFLGNPFGNLKRAKIIFEALIPDSFKKLWLTFLQNSAENGRGAGLFPLTSPDGSFWLISFRAQGQGDKLYLFLKDETVHLQPLIKEEIERRKKTDDGDEANKLLGIIHLIIFKTQTIPIDIREWSEKTQRLLKEGRFWPIGNQTRMIATKYEDDGVEKSVLIHPLVDDLICLPLDRLLFLQKVEIVMNLPGLTRPRYLFNQQVNFSIEISKKARIEKISDIGFAIRNPIGLQEGVTAHFYIELPNLPEPLDVYGKVLRSRKHPENPNQYLVYFTFLYLPKDYVTAIRKFLSFDPHYKPIVDEDTSHFRYNPDNIFLSKEEKRIKTVVLIDPDEKNLKSLLNTFRSQIQQIKVLKETSFYLFSKKHLDVDADVSGEKRAIPASSDDLFADKISWIVNPESENIEKFLTSPRESDQILGHDAIMLFFQPRGWLELFKDKDNKEVLQESMLVAISGQPIRKVFELSHQDGRLRYVMVEVSKANTSSKEELVKLEISVPAESDLRHEIKADTLDQLDMIVIDQSMVPDDVDSWLSGLAANAQRVGLTKADRDVKVLVMGQVESKSKLQALRFSKAVAIIPKPVDARFLLAHVSSVLSCPFSVYSFDNLGWSNRQLNTFIAKPAELMEIAEYGACIRHGRPIVAGTTLFLHGSIFEQAPGRNLCARFYHCEKDEKQKGQYICHLTYYGITETFLKYTRAWIRENYVSKKANQVGM